MSPKDVLTQRGIYLQSLAALWSDSDSDYWIYPVYSVNGEIIGYRQKRYPFSSKQAKYLWLDAKPKNPESDWYLLLDTIQAIKNAGGVCYLANGEPAVLAYRAGGIFNVISTTLSEISVPKNVLSYLNAIGVIRLIYIVDKDEAGEKSAINWRNALSGRGVDFETLQWGDIVSKKGDANDTLIACNFDIAAFQEMIAGLEPLELPTPETKPPRPTIEDFSKTPQGLIDTIASYFNINAWDSEGFSRHNVLCPFHDDSIGNESAGFNHISGVLNCFACGSHSPKQVAERLGIDWKAFYPKAPKKANPKRVKLTPVPSAIEDTEFTSDIALPLMYATIAHPAGLYTSWIDLEELPKEWVKDMLQISHIKSNTVPLAIKMHRAIRRGKLNPEKMSISQIMKALECSRKSAQSLVNSLQAWGFLPLLATIKESLSLATEGVKNLAGGRPEIFYTINAHTETLAYNIAEFLEPALIEKLSDDGELAPRSVSFRDSLDLDLADYKTWYQRTISPKQEYILKRVQERVCELLESTAIIEFTDEDLESTANLRLRLLHDALAPFSQDKTETNKQTGEITALPKGVQWSREKLTFELGGSESSLSYLYKQGNIGVKPMQAFYQVINPNNCDIEKELREAPFNLNKDLGGSSIAIALKVWDKGVPRSLKLVYMDKAKETFEYWNGRIERLDIFVKQPSLLWNMNAEEIEAKAAKEAKIAAKALASAETEEERATIRLKLEKQSEKKERKAPIVTGKDRTYRGHNPHWMQDEIAKEVAEFTDYTLERLSIVSVNGEIIAKLQSLREVVIWLNQYAKERVVVKQTKVEIIEKIEAPMSLPVVEKLKATSKQAPDFEGWCWANHPDEFNERMKAIGG